MRVTVTTLDGSADVLNLEITSDLCIKDLKAVIESESAFGIKATDMSLIHDGKVLQDDNLTLEQCHIKNDDLLTCQRRRVMPTTGNHPTMGGHGSILQNIQQLFQTVRSNPALRDQMRRTDPAVANAVERNNFEDFMRLMTQRMNSRHRAPQADLDLLDPAIQQRIEEEINMENVRDNMEHAYEYAPEFFGHVVMLYINCRVNGHSVKAFVDSGAQMTIMSKTCAERCGIMRLVDRRFSGIARGVGTQEIIGRIHLAQLEVEKQFFAISLSVLADQSMDMLIGLDMLRRHRCIIDLEKSVLRIENVVETPFLSEAELPDYAKLSNDPSSMDTDAQAQSHNEAAAATTNSNQSTTSATGSSSSRESVPFPEKTIQDIMKKGFTREEVIVELRNNQGDPMKAIVALMAKSLTKPRSKN